MHHGRLSIKAVSVTSLLSYRSTEDWWATAESERKSCSQKLNKLTFELQANKTLNEAEMAGFEIQIDRPFRSCSENVS